MNVSHALRSLSWAWHDEEDGWMFIFFFVVVDVVVYFCYSDYHGYHCADLVAQTNHVKTPPQNFLNENKRKTHKQLIKPYKQRNEKNLKKKSSPY